MRGEIKHYIMSTSLIRIKKHCEWCGNIFEAQKCSTRYCSHRCSGLAYKDRARQKRKLETEQRAAEVFLTKTKSSLEGKNFLSVQDAASLLGVKRNAVYNLLYSGKLSACRLSERLTRIKREDIEKMIEARPYKRKPRATSDIQDENGEQIIEFYTTKEIMDKFGVSNSWVFAQAKINNIPKVFHRGKTLWSKGHCDKVFTKKPEQPKENDWISYADTMAEFNLTRDQLYSYVKYHGLRRKKVGKQTFIVRAEIEYLLKPPTL